MKAASLVATWILCCWSHMVNVEGGNARTVMFDCEKYNPSTKAWKTVSSPEKGSVARLKCCSLGNEKTANCTIYRVWGKNESPLNSTYDDSSDVLIHELHETDCWMTSTYRCKCGNDNVPVSEMSLGIEKCGPKLCTDDASLETVEYVVPQKTYTFTLECIRSYHGISDSAHLNGTELKRNNLHTDGRWRWNYTNGEFSRYSVEIHLTNVSEQDYGEHNFTFFSTDEEEYKMEYRIVLKKPGPPECPKDVRVTETGISHVSLKWTPGYNRFAVEQTFHVRHRMASYDHWRMVLPVTKNSSVTIENLKAYEDHAFIIVSSNVFGEAECMEVINVTTGPMNSGGHAVVDRLSFAVVLGAAGLCWASRRWMLGYDWLGMPRKVES